MSKKAVVSTPFVPKDNEDVSSSSSSSSSSSASSVKSMNASVLKQNIVALQKLISPVATSYEDEESQGSRISQKECLKVENNIGFKPYGSNNYYCSIFHRDTKDRTVLFDGAVSLDEYVNYMTDFFRHYVSQGIPTTLYFLSVLLTDKTHYTIFTMEGKAMKRDRLRMVYTVLPLFVQTFDTLFEVFIKDGNRKFHSYREDTPIQKLIQAFSKYQEVKKQLHILVAPVANE